MSRRGFALMAALWLLVAIAIISLGISTTARARRLAAANSLETSRARAAAESGIEHARAMLSRMLMEGGSGRMWRDSVSVLDPWSDVRALTSDSVAMEGGEWYRVELVDLGTRLNLNRATEARLQRYLVARRIDAGVASRIAQAIADWRDPDDLRRAQGAEVDDYRRAGAAELPANAPFGDADELRHVAGVTPELYQRLRADLTTLGSGRININAADRALLLSLPGLSEPAVDVILTAQQSRRRIRSFQELTDVLPLTAREAVERSAASLLPLLAFETREVGVTSEGHASGSPVRVVGRALITRGGSAEFVTWRVVR